MFSLRQHRIKVIIGTAKCVCCCRGTNSCMCIDISYLRTLPSAITVDAAAFVFNKDALRDNLVFHTQWSQAIGLCSCVCVHVFVCVGTQYIAHTPNYPTILNLKDFAKNILYRYTFTCIHLIYPYSCVCVDSGNIRI